jgi:hypothetical protein
MLDYDPSDRAAFREALAAHLAAAFPDATLEWLEDGRRLLITFPGIGACSIWEPNFFFSRSAYSDAELLDMAAAAIAGQRVALTNHQDI